MTSEHKTDGLPGPAIRALLDWYAAMGVVDLVAEQPVNRLNREKPPSAAPSLPDPSTEGKEAASPAQRAAARPQAGDAATATARTIAASCATLNELEAALSQFDGCPLKETAINLCFADGDRKAKVMLIGEAPGADEDRQGRPFVGPSGRLLDRMLATIGLDRTTVYITNVIFWRPPGNRTPTASEIAVCQPFLERQIELLRPKLIVFVGGIAARVLLGRSEGVTRLRGRPFTYSLSDGTAIPAIVMFHPAYLLRQPAQKRLSWRDLLMIKHTLARLGADEAEVRP